MGKIGEGVIVFWPLTKSFLLFSLNDFAKFHKNRIITTDRQKDASDFIINLCIAVGRTTSRKLP